MKAKVEKAQIVEFLAQNQFRSDFAKVLGMDFAESEKSKLSFRQLKRAAMEKLFGSTPLVEECYIEDEIAILERCIKRDEDNYNSQTKIQKHRSILPLIVKDDKRELAKLKAKLAEFLTTWKTDLK